MNCCDGARPDSITNCGIQTADCRLGTRQSTSNLQSERQRARTFLSSLALLLLLPAAALAQTRLTTDGTLKRDPHFTKDGSALIYCTDQTVALVRMMRLDLASGETSVVFEDAGDKHHVEPALSPDQRFIAYTQCTGNLTARLVIRDQQEAAEAKAYEEAKAARLATAPPLKQIAS